MESFNLQDKGTAIIDYAHTPDSYNKVMITLKELQGIKAIFMLFLAQGVIEIKVNDSIWLKY